MALIFIALAASSLAFRTQAETIAYWEFDTFADGTTPAAVGGAAMDLRTAGAGSDFRRVDAPGPPPVPNPDRTPGFRGDRKANRACLRSPGNPVQNRFLTTSAGANVLRLHKSAWTFEGWVRCAGDEPDGFGDVILTTRDEPRWCGLTLKVDKPLRAGEGRRLSCYFEVKAHSEGDTASAFGRHTDGLLLPGRWHHIALTWDARGDGPPTVRIFVDGIVAIRAEAPPTFDTALADRYTLDCLHMGAREGSERNTFAGDMDEFRISDRALDPVDMLIFPDRPGPLPRACQVAKARKLHPRTPRSSDVLMRSLRWRPITTRDRRDTMQAMDAFHVTGLVWSYIHDPEVIAKVRQSGRFFQGAVTSSLSTMRSLLGLPTKADEAETAGFIQRYSCLSLDGSPNEQPWKRHWPNPYSRCSGCCSNPEFEPLYVRALKTYIDAGATMIQRDEGVGNAYRPSYGGCFCDHCMRGFRGFLRERLTAEELAELGVTDISTFDYRVQLRQAGAPVGDKFSRWDGGRLQQFFRQYQHHVSLGFMARTRKALDKTAGFSVAMSCNNGVRIFDEITQQFDWFFGELSRSHATPANLYRNAVTASKLDRLQILTMPKKGAHSTYDDPGGWERHTRQTIATSYAVGGICMVPWDVYMPNTMSEDRKRSATPRYFGKVKDYADLFGFIRANAALLDGYEDAAAIGPGMFETRWGRQFPVTIEGAEGVYAFVRAKPGDRTAPVVVHLVDWRDRPRPFRLGLRTKAFSEDPVHKLALRVPIPYEPGQHQAAEEEAQRLRRARQTASGLFAPEHARAYAPLSRTQELKPTVDGLHAAVDLPALTPWGIVVVDRR